MAFVVIEVRENGLVVPAASFETEEEALVKAHEWNSKPYADYSYRVVEQ